MRWRSWTAGGRRALMAGAVAATVIAGSLTVVASAQQAEAATPQVGQDISWTNCPTPSGYGQPMPPDSTDFVVIGLTWRHQSAVQNPCLVEQARWIRERARPFQAYLYAVYPVLLGSDQVDALRASGRAQAAAAVASLKATGLKPDRVWIDVELDGNGNGWPWRWPGATTKQTGNKAVLQGIVDELATAGLQAGFYSNADSWKNITGGWERLDLPFWEVIGYDAGMQAAALKRCATPGQDKGPVHLVQFWDKPIATKLFDLACPGHSFATPKATLDWPTVSASASLASAPRVTLTGGPARRESWWLTVQDACTGAAVRSLNGTTSDLISVSWDGLRDDATPAGPGLYRLVLRTGLTGPDGPTLTALHELVQPGSTKIRGCRTTRTYGDGDSYGTAVAAGQVNYPKARTVVLVSGEPDHVADATTAAPLARVRQAPLLLTAAGALPAVVRADLVARKVTSVTIVGNTAGVSAAVETALKGLGITVRRIAGADQYETAAKVALQIGGGKHEILIASGETGQVADAILASGPAAGLGLPVLLVTATAIPAKTASALRALGSTKARVTVVGNPAAIRASVLTALKAKAKSVHRVSGADRPALALALATEYGPRLGAGEVVVVNQVSPVLMLVASGLGRPVLLTATTALTAPTVAWLSGHKGTPVRVVGAVWQVGPAAVAAIG